MLTADEIALLMDALSEQYGTTDDSMVSVLRSKLKIMLEVAAANESGRRPRPVLPDAEEVIARRAVAAEA